MAGAFGLNTSSPSIRGAYNIIGKINAVNIKTDNSGKQKRFFLNKPLYFWVRLILGTIFVLASIDKIIHPAAFAKAVYNYQILPDIFINLTAIILPWVELILGIFLILGLWFPGAVLLANLLLVTFFAALLFNLARGLDVQCSCFTTSKEATSSLYMYLYVIRDGMFLSLGIYLLYHIFSKKT